VILKGYKGNSKKVIIPSFVTVIGPKAFYESNIEEVIIGEGTKVICEEAFSYNSIKKVEIPTTVEFIGKEAFASNHGVINGKSALFIVALYKMNPNTIVADEIKQQK